MSEAFDAKGLVAEARWLLALRGRGDALGAATRLAEAADAVQMVPSRRADPQPLLGLLSSGMGRQ